MYKIRMETKRPFNWKALWVLLAKLAVAAPIIIPFSMTLTGTTMADVEQQLAEAGTSMPTWLAIAISPAINFALAAVLWWFGPAWEKPAVASEPTPAA